MRARGAWLLAAAVAGLAGAAAGGILTGDLHIDGRRGDWRAASEGLYRSGQPGVLGAGRHVVVHFHGLDGRPGTLALEVAARPASPEITVTAAALGSPPAVTTVGVEETAITVPVPAGTRDLDVRLESTALFRVSGIDLRRPRGGMASGAMVVGALAGLAVAFARRRASVGLVLATATLSAVVAAAAWVAAVDPGSAVRFDAPVRLALVVAIVALAWIVALWDGGAAMAVAAIVLTVAIHWPTLGYGFHQDDFALARGWSAQELAATLRGEFDPSGMIPAYYRPVVRLSWAVDHALWSARTAPYHATNLVLHVLASLTLLALLRRLRFSPRAALLGAAAWAAHPLAASAATWVSARGDSLATLFYLSALVFFCARTPTARSRTAMVACTGLAFAAKEMAATLPAAAWLIHHFVLPAESRRERRPALRVLVLLTAAYAAVWVALMAGKVMVRVGHTGARWARFDPADPSDWINLLPALYLPVFLPPRYEDWWVTPMTAWPVAYRLAALAVPIAVCAIARKGTREASGAGVVAALWPLATVPPLLALSNTVDLYRLGYLVAIAIAFAVSAIVMRVERWPWAAAVVAVALAALEVPISVDAAHAWAPDGFRGRASLHWKVNEPAWVGQLTPEMQGVFRDTAARHCHALRWVYPDEACP